MRFEILTPPISAAISAFVQRLNAPEQVGVRSTAPLEVLAVELDMGRNTLAGWLQMPWFQARVDELRKA